AIALARRERGWRAGRDELVGRVAAVEVAERKASGGHAGDDRDREGGAVGAAEVAAEHVVDEVLSRRDEGAVTGQVLLEVELRRRRLDDPLLHAWTARAGRRREGSPGVVARHTQLAGHEIDDRARDVLLCELTVWDAK